MKPFEVCTLMVCLAAGLRLDAQGQPPSDAAEPWRQFRAPDGMFTVMFHSSQPVAQSTKDSGYVTVSSYTSELNGTTFSVRRISHRFGASLKHLPSIDGFCATCLGKVVSETIRGDSQRAERWLLIEHESPGSDMKTTVALRVLGFGSRVYVVRAESAPGEPLPPDIGWFLTSFSQCWPSEPCPVIVDGLPPWTVFPFRYLPPNGTVTEMISGAVDLGQPFLDYQVDDSVVDVRGAEVPSYPPALRAAGVEGEVRAKFVVDTTGRVEMPTLAFVFSTDSAFASTVKGALPAIRFLPATLNGRKVRQWVERSYPFKLQR